MVSLQHKLWFSFGGLLAVLVAASIITVVALTHHSRILELVFRENYDSIIYCEGMNDALDELNSRAQHFIWKGDSAAFADYGKFISQFDDNLKLQIGNAHMPTEPARTQSLAQSWSAFKDLYSQLARSRDPSATYRDELLPRFESMKQMAHEIAALNANNMVSVDGQVKKTLVDVRNVLIVFVMFGAVFAAAVLWAAGTAILNPIRALTRSAHRVEQGDLDQSIEVKARDEMGDLAEAFNSMAAKLREFRRIDHARLARTQQTTQLAIDSLPDAVFVIGPDERIEISNRTARSHFGIEPGKTIAQIGLKWLTPLYEAVQRERRPIESQNYRSAVQLFEGTEERFLLPRAVPIMEDGRELNGVCVILADVTRLRRVDEAKSSVISIVSHELRTPLTGLRMSLSLLASNNFGQVSDDQKRLIGASREESDRLYRLIENLLNIGRIESGRAPVPIPPDGPRRNRRSRVNPLRPIFEEKKIQLKLLLADNLPSMQRRSHVNQFRLDQPADQRGSSSAPGGAVTIAAENTGPHVIFSVSDTGPGIPAQYRGRIFEKFFRIPSESGPTGAGLGLTIAKEIAEAHGGQIEFTCPRARRMRLPHFTSGISKLKPANPRDNRSLICASRSS